MNFCVWTLEGSPRYGGGCCAVCTGLASEYNFCVVWTLEGSPRYGGGWLCSLHRSSYVVNIIFAFVWKKCIFNSRDLGRITKEVYEEVART